jgi:hypothetical protein
MRGAYVAALAALLLAPRARAQGRPGPGPRQPGFPSIQLPNPDFYGDVGGTVGVAAVHHPRGTAPTVTGGLSLAAAYEFPWVTVGVAADVWELAPAHDVGGRGGELLVTFARSITSAAAVDLRAAFGYGVDELQIRSDPDAPSASHEGLVFRVGIAKERRYEAGKGVVFTADLLTGNVGGGQAPVLRFPLLQLGVSFRGHRLYRRD